MLDDPDLTTWSAYAVRAWPTLAVVDPEGYVVAQLSGEGHAHGLRVLLDDLVAEHEAKGTLHRGDGPYVAPEPEPSDLRFPAKAVRLPNGTLLVADAGHHQLVELAADLETVVRRIGSGVPGPGRRCGRRRLRFDEPNGVCLLPADVAALGRLRRRRGRHRQPRAARRHDSRRARSEPLQAPENSGCTETGTERLSSPWDVVWSAERRRVVVAMAGIHQLWTFDPVDRRRCTVLAGHHERGSAGRSARGGVAGPDLRSRRRADPRRGTALVRRLRDVVVARRWRTARSRPRRQRALRLRPRRRRRPRTRCSSTRSGVTVLPDGSVAVSDTYNGAIRRYDPVDADGDDAGDRAARALGRASSTATPSSSSSRPRTG